MPDITSILDRTTPDDVAPLDVAGLVRRSRRRRAGRWAAMASIMVVVLTLGVAVTGPDGGTARRESGLVAAPPGPDGRPLAEPVGAWTQADDPPFSPRTDAFGGALPDGRVVVWGGQPLDGQDGTDVPIGPADGGILDPATGRWEPIPAAPVPPPTTGGLFMTSARLVDGRLAIVTGAADATLHAAVYDIALGTWAEAPVPVEVPFVYDAMAWDGETLVLVRTRPGRTGDLNGSHHDWRVNAPITLRWRPGDDHWAQGAPPPFGLRDLVGTAVDGPRLAVWGGSGPDAQDTPGAVYTLATDSWAPIPAGPLPALTHATVEWSDGRLLVGEGPGEDNGENAGDLAAYDPITGEWETLAGPPEGGISPGVPHWWFDAGRERVLRALPSGGSGEPEPIWFRGPEGWEQAPLGAVMSLDGYLVTMLGYDNLGSIPHEVQVRAARGVWMQGAEAPFVHRRGATTVATGHRLVVVGGAEGRDLAPASDVWVFDLAG